MKNVNFISFAVFIALFLAIPSNSNAQFFKKLKKHVEKKVEKEAEDRVNKKADEGVDEVFDTVEEGAEDAVTGDGSEIQDSVDQKEGTTNTEDESVDNIENHTPEIKWAKYDFVPGDEVLFEDGPSPDEENGEFPSRWDLVKGNVEIVEFDGEKVISFLGGHPEIIPYIANNDEDYLPEVFTIEFDVYFYPNKGSMAYVIDLFDKKNQIRKRNDYGSIYPNGIQFGKSKMMYPGGKNIYTNDKGGWKHIALAFTKGKLKMYMDDTRLINIPRYDKNPTGLTFSIPSAGYGISYIKNIRIAKGGVKYYDKFLTDGKIIVNGIRFDVNKSTIKPESNGAINNIYELMKKHSDVKFSIEGHTDSDGDENYNLKLSEERANAVMDRLINMGIDADRLKYKGFGESKPIDPNGTPEGKANNRRVEFVKI